MQATEILFNLGGRLLNVMCLFICIVIYNNMGQFPRKLPHGKML